MDGIHDMGGMHGFGRVPYALDDPSYHEDWERRVFGMSIGSTAPPYMNLDYNRHSLERIPPDVYLSSSYYERWLYSLIMRHVESGQVTLEEVAAGHASADTVVRDDAVPPEAMNPYLYLPFRKDIAAAPRFAVGDSVTTANPQTRGHTRLPRYARCKRGQVHLHHGAHVFPDASAAGQGEQHLHLYTLKFSARELWGPDASPIDHVYVDVWECHLEAV